MRSSRACSVVRRGVIQTPSALAPEIVLRRPCTAQLQGARLPPEEPVTPTAMVLTPTSTMRSDAPSIDPMPSQTMEVPIQMRDATVQMLQRDGHAAGLGAQGAAQRVGRGDGEFPHEPRQQ